MTLPPLPTVDAGPFARAIRWDGRIAGLDLARALALIGMFAAHLGDSGRRGSDAAGWRWLWIADGRSSAIFAVLAGVTISMLAAKDPIGPSHAAARVATRGVLLTAAGYAVGALGTPVDVILPNLGLMFVLVIPLMRWRPPALLAAAAVAMTLGAFVARQQSDSLDGWPMIEKLVSENYPAIAWAGYVLVGMAVGRMELTRRLVLRLAWGGAAFAALAYGAGIACGGAAPWQDPHAKSAAGAAWASVAPHANTTFELVGNAGAAVLVIGLAVALSRPSRWLFPLLAFGSMSLTMYTAHVFAIAAVGESIVWQPSNVALVATTLALVAAATAWRVVLGAGPLERLVTIASKRVADAATRSG